MAKRRDILKGLAATAFAPALIASAEHGNATVYELRVYHCNPGKLPALLERFRKREMKIFARLDLHVLAVWTPADEPASTDTLVYLLRHESREAAAANWKRFSADPEWMVVKAETEKDGALVGKHDITFLKLTDFSPAL